MEEALNLSSDRILSDRSALAKRTAGSYDWRGRDKPMVENNSDSTGYHFQPIQCCSVFKECP